MHLLRVEKLIVKMLVLLELAYRELAAAKRAVADAEKGLGSNEFQVALDKLSPAAQDFVKYILSLKEAFEELRKKLQEAFFPKFTEAVKLLVETYLPSSLEEDLIKDCCKTWRAISSICRSIYYS
jgi:uncharacterized protein with PhoU and TrkA domain